MEHFDNISLMQMMNKAEPEISESGLVKLDSQWDSYGLCSPFSRMYYVLEGEGYLRWGDKEVCLRPGYFYFLPCGLTVDFWCPDKLYKLYFHVNIYRPDRYDYFLGATECLEIAYPEAQLLAKLYRGETALAAMKLRLILFRDIFSAMERLALPIEQKLLSTVVQAAVDYINENLSLKLSRKEIADKLYVSESFLCRKFREEVGVSMGKYMDDHIFFAAQKLLRNSAYSIAEISEQLGFCDQFYFSRRFSERYGEPPTRFRKRLGILF